MPVSPVPPKNSVSGAGHAHLSALGTPPGRPATRRILVWSHVGAFTGALVPLRGAGHRRRHELLIGITIPLIFLHQ